MREACNVLGRSLPARFLSKDGPVRGLVTDFERLEVYQEAKTVATLIFEVTNGFPREEPLAKKSLPDSATTPNVEKNPSVTRADLTRTG